MSSFRERSPQVHRSSSAKSGPPNDPPKPPPRKPAGQLTDKLRYECRIPTALTDDALAGELPWGPPGVSDARRSQPLRPPSKPLTRPRVVLSSNTASRNESTRGWPRSARRSSACCSGPASEVPERESSVGGFGPSALGRGRSSVEDERRYQSAGNSGHGCIDRATTPLRRRARSGTASRTRQPARSP